MALDAELEKAIDDTGRDKVFALAKALGWRDDPPKYVWWTIVHEVRRREFAKDIKAADQRPPEAAFDNVDDMMAWLNKS